MKKIYLLFFICLMACNTTSNKIDLSSETKEQKNNEEMDPLTREASEYAIKKCTSEISREDVELVLKENKTPTELEKQDAHIDDFWSCYWANRRDFIWQEGSKEFGYNPDYVKCSIGKMKEVLGDKKFNFIFEEKMGATPKTVTVEPTIEDLDKFDNEKYRCTKKWITKAKTLQSKADKRKLKTLMKLVEDRVPDNPKGQELANITSDCFIMSYAVFGNGYVSNFMENNLSKEQEEKRDFIFKECIQSLVSKNRSENKVIK